MKYFILSFITLMSIFSSVLAEPTNNKDNIQHTEIKGVIINRAIGPNARSEQNIGGKNIPENTVIITTNGVTTRFSQESPERQKNTTSNSKSFTNQNLNGRDFSKQNLSNNSFVNTSLIKSNFQKSNLQNSDFTNTNMSNSDLRKSNLQNSNLTNVNMTDADLRESNLKGCNITNVNFTGAKLEGAIWVDGRSCSVNSIGVCR